MAECAAQLLDHVIPDVPVRQWVLSVGAGFKLVHFGGFYPASTVLSLPYRLRYQLAWDHERVARVVGVFVRAVPRFLRTRARWTA